MTKLCRLHIWHACTEVLLLVHFRILSLFLICLIVTCLLFQNSALWVSYVSILLVILFVVMFAIGPGSIPWFLVSELFNQSARGAATSLAVAVNWTANFIVGIGFLPLQVSLTALSVQLTSWSQKFLFLEIQRWCTNTYRYYLLTHI